MSVAATFKVAVGLTGIVLSFAASASAVELTSPIPNHYTGKVDASSEGGHATFANGIATISCASTVEAEISKTKPPEGVSNVTFTGCTNSWHVTTLKLSSVKFEAKAVGEGTIKSTGLEVDTTRLGVTCVYLTSATDIGVFTDSFKTPNGTATLDISASIPIEPITSSGLCGTGNAKWEGAYSVTQPDPLYIDQ